MALPAHVVELFSCDVDVDREGFASHLESIGAEALPWFLQDQAARDALVASLFDGNDPVELVVHDLADGVTSFGYQEIGSVQGDLRFLLKVPGGESPNAALPTGALVALARLWPKQPDLLAGTDVTQLSESYRNKLLVFSVGDSPDWDKDNLTRVAASLLGCRLHILGKDPADPHWTSVGRVELEPTALASQSVLMAGRLLQEVLSETRIRWRYIALYRIFEAAYLIGLKENLVKNFLDGPKEALSVAQDALESELSTFKKLVSDKNLGAHFEALRVIVDGDTSNRFLHAIKRALKSSKSSGYNTGVEYAYKVRCAIVHAGQHDVVFDRYSDGEAGVRLLLQPMEEAVLGLLGLRKV